MFINTNLASKVQKEWYLPQWSYLFHEVSKIFKLNSKEKEKLSNSTTAKIIATIPFEAKCKEPERTAIAHLCLYMAELKGFQKYCAHTKDDDSNIYNRLAFISTFEGGEAQIIEHGMAMLALIMIEGYKKSKQKDVKAEIYNPLVSGAWNYQVIKNSLLWK
ncbi:MAG: hypothetical protein HUJ68_07055, partial [Clostridia bacterium]|nr:hypothetical protein [Clostridia bacterium]